MCNRSNLVPGRCARPSRLARGVAPIPILLAAAASLALAGGGPLAGAQQNSEATIENGRQLVALFMEGDLSTLWARMSGPLRQGLGSEQALAQFRDQVEAQLGAEISVVRETGTREQEMDVYTRKARFSKTGNTVIDVVFITDSSGIITGFWVRPSASQPSPPEEANGEPREGETAAMHEGIRSIVPIAPTVVAAQGRRHLVYELRVLNRRKQMVTLTGLDVLNADGSRPLLTLRGTALQAAHGGSDPGAWIDANSELLLYLWVSAAARVPTALQHRLHLRDADGVPFEAIGPALTPRPAQPMRLGPPLRGDSWLALNGPSNTSIHRRARIAVNQHQRIAQRFAIDFVQLREGATYHGNPEDNTNYLAYGKQALAVADGTVAALHDGIPNNVPGPDSRAVEITLETVAGNYVILDLGEGRYAFYAHLQPASLRVALGDHVTRGQVLGRVGNTGNSTEPHLHFHIADAPSPLGAEGLPYVFERFLFQGDMTRSQEVAPVSEAKLRTNEIPLQGTVLAFVGHDEFD